MAAGFSWLVKPAKFVASQYWSASPATSDQTLNGLMTMRATVGLGDFWFTEEALLTRPSATESVRLFGWLYNRRPHPAVAAGYHFAVQTGENIFWRWSHGKCATIEHTFTRRFCKGAVYGGVLGSSVGRAIAMRENARIAFK